MGAGDATVVCRFQYSGRPVALVAGLALATLAVVALAPAPTIARILAATWTVCVALAAASRVPFLPGAAGPRALAIRASGEVAVQSASGAWRSGELRDGGFVAAWLVVVRWRPEGARFDRTILILPGMTDARTLRKIRVILRWR
jgi:hypothetical protein